MAKRPGKKHTKPPKQTQQKVNQDSSRANFVILGEKTPQLPACVFTIIAEHLISQYAFKTVASLNVASKAIQAETLPVLYESFFYNDFRKLSNARKGLPILPEAVQYTKYIFYASSEHRIFPRLKEFPNAVMTISVNDFDACQFRLLKPVSSATAFTIIETPFRHSPTAFSGGDHHMCTSSMDLIGWLAEILGQEFEPENDPFEEIPLPKDCLETKSQPSVRSVSQISEVVLAKGAHLHHHPPERLSNLKTNLRMHALTLKTTTEGVIIRDLLSTYFELMKAAAMQRSAKHLANMEKALIEPFGWGIKKLGSKSCMCRPSYEDWHIKMTYTLRVAKSFVRKLKIEAETDPKILLNRLHITISDEVTAADIECLLDGFSEIYATHVTGMRHVLPTREQPPELVQCFTKLRMEPATAATDAVIPLVATELTGSIKVISKRRGVKVVVEFDKQQHFPHENGAYIEDEDE